MAWALPEGAVLGVFGTRPGADPSPGLGLGAEADAAAREAMLLDVLDAWSAAEVLAPGGRRVVAFAPGDEGPWFDARVPEAFALVPQDGAGPGPDVHGFLAGELGDGAARVVAVVQDAPTLDPTVVVSAFLCLDGRDVVVGPATDGGLYLVGCRGEAPAVLEGLDVRDAGALARLVDRLDATGLTLAVLPPWYAVNSAGTWRTLCGHLRALRRAGVRPGLPRVEAVADGLRPPGPVEPDLRRSGP